MEVGETPPVVGYYKWLLELAVFCVSKTTLKELTKRPCICVYINWVLPGGLNRLGVLL